MPDRTDLANAYRLTAVFTLVRALRAECVAQLEAEFGDSLTLSPSTMMIRFLTSERRIGALPHRKDSRESTMPSIRLS